MSTKIYCFVCDLRAYRRGRSHSLLRGVHLFAFSTFIILLGEKFLFKIPVYHEHRGPQWHSGKGAVLQIGRSLVRSQMVSLEFFIDIKSFRSHYGPGIDSASNRNEYQEHFLGVKAAGA